MYLVDEMHVSLGKTLAVEDQAPVPEPLTDSVQLKHFAREAEVNGNYELATKYYLEVSVECGVISGYCFSKAHTQHIK